MTPSKLTIFKILILLPYLFKFLPCWIFSCYDWQYLGFLQCYFESVLILSMAFIYIISEDCHPVFNLINNKQLWFPNITRFLNIVNTKLHLIIPPTLLRDGIYKWKGEISKSKIQSSKVLDSVILSLDVIRQTGLKRGLSERWYKYSGIHSLHFNIWTHLRKLYLITPS